MPDASDDNSAASRHGGNKAPASQRLGAWRQARAHIAIILTIGSCVVVLLWIIMFVVTHNERQAAIDHARDEANNLSAALRWECEQTLASIERAMDSIADHVRASPTAFDIHDWATGNPMLPTGAVQAGVISADGKLASSTLEPHPVAVDLSDREHFRVHRDGTVKGVFISKPVLGRLSGQFVLQISKRVAAADGTFLGVVVFSLPPEQLTRLHESINVGPRGKLAIVGTDDHIVRARVGGGGIGGLIGADELAPPPTAQASESVAPRDFIRTSAINHIMRLYSVRELPDYPLSVTVALDLTDIIAVPEAHRRLIMATTIIASLMLVVLMLLLVAEIRDRTDRELSLAEERARLAQEIEQGRRIEARLRSSEAKLRDFAEMASDWFWEQDAELRFIPGNADGPALPSDRQALLGKRRWEVNDTSLASEQWAGHRHDLLARKPFRDFRFPRANPDGTTQFVSINGVPVHGEAGEFMGYRGTGRDITALVLAEAELRRSRDQAEAANRAKSTFLANMSHELRTPLHAIIGFAELLRDRKTGPITADHVAWAADILAAGRHLLDLINDVLELSRIEAGRFDPRDETLDLGAVVRACVSMIRRQAEQQELRVDCAIRNGAVFIRADRRAVKQVVLNLLTNAVKFTPSGGAVSIGVNWDGASRLELEVRDTGIGIDPETLPKLCQPFVQADVATNRRYGGTGLGLAISSRLMELHGGCLTVHSAPGEGTTVRAQFPSTRVLAVSQTEVEPV